MARRTVLHDPPGVPVLFLTFVTGLNIIVAVPYRYGARSDRLRGVERDAEVRKLCWAADVLRVDLPKRRTGQTPAEGADGSSACPGDSSHERGAGAQAPNPGTSSKPINPSVCGTQVRSCFRGPGSV